MGTRFDRPSVSLTAKLSARQVEAAFKLLDKREKKVKEKWSARNRRLDEDREQPRSNVNSGLPIAPPVTPSSSLQKVLNEGLAGGWQDISQQEESSGGVTERGQAASAMSMVHYFGHNAIVGQRRRPSSARYPSQEQRHSICNSTPTRRPQSAQNRLTDEKSKGGISGLNSHRHPMTAPSPSNGSGQGSFGQNHFSIFAGIQGSHPLRQPRGSGLSQGPIRRFGTTGSYPQGKDQNPPHHPPNPYSHSSSSTQPLPRCTRVRPRSQHLRTEVGRLLLRTQCQALKTRSPILSRVHQQTTQILKRAHLSVVAEELCNQQGPLFGRT